MARTNLTIVVLGSAAVVALALPGCSSDVPTEESTAPVAEFNTVDAARQDALLSKIGRGLALALSDPATRAWVRSRIDASPYVEWRIPFREVLLHEAGLPAVRRVGESSRLTSAERERQNALPDLELYFPIPKHRTGWQPSAPVQVAVRQGHSETYTVYAMDGTSSVSRGDRVPAVATLVLAPSEIDYRDLASAVRGGSRTGPGMQAQLSGSGAGTTALPPPPPPPPLPPPTGGIDVNHHTRLGFFRTTRYHDDIFGGNDEVEIYASINNRYRECTWRTDVRPNTDYFFDLANSFSTIATAVPTGTWRIFVDAWEDDDARCVLRSSDDHYGVTLLTIGQYGMIVGTSSPGHIALRLNSVVP